MIMRLIISSFLFLVISVFTNVLAQNASFTIYQGKKKLGTITTNKVVDGTKSTYVVNSDVVYYIFKKFHRVSKMQATYQNGVLQSSIAKAFTNDKIEEEGVTTRKSGHYQCKEMGKEKESINESEIRYSISSLYFEEPVNRTNVYSERFLNFGTIEHTGNHVYKVTLNGSSVNYYKYKNGQLDSIDIQRVGFHLQFKRDY